MKNGFYIDMMNSNDVKINDYDGADKKAKVIYEGNYFLLKYPSYAKYNDKASYSNNVFSEYIGCHIFNLVGIKAQETYLGIIKNKVGKEKYACACKDFTNKDVKLVEFSKLVNSYDDDAIRSGSTDIFDIENVLKNFGALNYHEIESSFWNMFIIDALIGNFDRHNGNWGILVEKNSEKIIGFSPVYDCGSCLFSQLTDEQIAEILSSEQEIKRRVFERPQSALKINNKKINYYDFINSLESKKCNEAIKRVTPKIKIEDINKMVDETPYISETRKKFYRVILTQRFKNIIEPAYKKLSE